MSIFGKAKALLGSATEAAKDSVETVTGSVGSKFSDITSGYNRRGAEFELACLHVNVNHLISIAQKLVTVDPKISTELSAEIGLIQGCVNNLHQHLEIEKPVAKPLETEQAFLPATS